MSLTSKSLRKLTKNPDLVLESLNEVVRSLLVFDWAAGEETAAIAHEDAEAADEMTHRPRPWALAGELGDRFLECPIDGHVSLNLPANGRFRQCVTGRKVIANCDLLE